MSSQVTISIVTGTIVGLLLVAALSISADAVDPRQADCEVKDDNTYVEDIMDADCEPDEQEGMVTSITDVDMPQYGIESQTLGYGEQTRVRVRIWHDNPNIDYNCQIRTRNGETQNSWTDFVEVPRKAHSNSPTTLLQTIEAPEAKVSAQQRVVVRVEVFCYGPAADEPYPGGFFGDNLWIAQAYFKNTVSYTYPSTSQVTTSTPTPTQTPTQTPTTTPSPTSTLTSSSPSPTSASAPAGGSQNWMDLLPFALGLVLLGLGGGGAIWWRTGGSDTSNGAVQSNNSGGTDSAVSSEPSPSMGQEHARSEEPSYVSSGSGSDLTAEQSLPGDPDTHEQAGLPSHEIIELVGQGGNAKVWKVRLTDTGEVVALKRPDFRETMTVDDVRQFLREAETWAQIDDHPNIVTVRDWGFDGQPWLLMEYVDGGNLGTHVGNVSIRGALDILIDVANALTYARGVDHLDIKAENILLDDVGRAKLADWGLARVAFQNDATNTRMGITPAYAAPEQIDRTRGELDNRTDIYQLGVTGYQLLTGELPFDPDAPESLERRILATEPPRPSALNPAIPPELDDVIMTAMAKERADRYERAIQFRDALRDVRDPLSEGTS